MSFKVLMNFSHYLLTCTVRTVMLPAHLQSTVLRSKRDDLPEALSTGHSRTLTQVSVNCFIWISKASGNID